MHYLILVRYKNLLLIALTMYLMRYVVLQPILITLDFSGIHFHLLVLSTLLMAAGGYIINDYFDLKTDRYNKPEKMVLVTKVSRDKAFRLYFVFTGLSVLMGVYLAYQIGYLFLSSIHFFTAFLLWSYSRYYKKQLMIGNITVALLSALVIYMVWIYELKALGLQRDMTEKAYTQLLIIVVGYVSFAFLITLIREVVKDLEDRYGDEKSGCRTLPIVLGVSGAKWVLFGLNVVALALLTIVEILWIKDMSLLFFYLIVFVNLPMLIMTILLIVDKREQVYAYCSIGYKWVMMLGVLSLFFIGFL